MKIRADSRPNIVRKFISENGKGKENVLVGVFNNTSLEGLTSEEIKELINEEFILDSLQQILE